ncbi:phage baseplate assembly protein V [Catellatospora sp. KI3]|uniref:phage baseplate assembly protein V n=1 Tax=Catellatospora sp. KI3 TaxID=3041620 RepID=UPI00248237A3|nr:phage baseplate assembly protein V [Catellatospora sp. KI3]MDI1463781.1 phage baseplate assembly protein V [Catellatospora sp. KI3]
MIIPRLSVRLDGVPVPGRVLSARVAYRISLPAQAELTVQDAGGWPFGARLRLELDGAELFDGEVGSVELVRGPGSETGWTVVAHDVLHRLRSRQRPRVFTDVTLADLAREATTGLGLAVRCPDPGPALERVVQHRATDWDLLSRTAARLGRYVYLDGRTLVVDTLRPHGSAVELKFGDTLWQCRAAGHADRALSAVTTYGWHPGRGEFTTERAAGPGYRPGATAPPAGLAAGAERTLIDQPVGHQAEAAQAAVDRGAARMLAVSGTCQGDVSIRPGRAVGISGVDPAVDGVYPVCTAVHTIDAAGYRTEFGTEAPEGLPAGTAAAIALGRVTEVGDSRGRVRVVLPGHGDLDLGWLPVLCPGAGPGKGVVALPDPGDLVVLALPREDPADAIVLGAVFGSQTPPDTGVKGGAVKRWTLHSAGGQQVVVDDAEKSITLTNADGSRLELSPSTVRLLARTDLVIEAPGHKLSIRAASVDFERALIPGLPTGVNPL